MVKTTKCKIDKFGYSIIEKSTGNIVGDDGEVYHYSINGALRSAKGYLTNLIANEFEGKTEDDFEIKIEPIIK